MARMHSGAKGRSGSTKPSVQQVPEWVDYSAEEIIETIVRLANQGHSRSEIGMILRDQYAVPSVKALTGKTVSQILEEKALGDEIPEDLMNLIRKSVALQDHLAENKKDFTAKRGYQLTVSKIRRLVKYYVKKNKLPKEWRYTEETARLLVK